MKKYLLQISLLSLVLISCGNKKSESNIQTGDNLQLLINEMKTKFSDTTLFHSIMFSFDEVMGNTILVKTAGNLDSIKVNEWFFASGKWDYTPNLQISTDSLKFTDRLFNLKSEYNLSTLSGLLTKTSEKLEKEKKIDHYIIKNINLMMGDLTGLSGKMENLITQFTVISVTDKKEYLFNYDYKGNFISISE